MNTLLVILGTIGLITIAISAYVFTVAARNYVSEEESGGEGDRSRERRNKERRSGANVEFPLDIDGVEITRDRRSSERRNGLS